MNIAIVQAPLIWEDVTGNLMAFDARLLKIDKADVIVLPEMFSSGFSMEGKEKIASQYDNVCQRMQVWAENKQALVIGSTVFCVGRHFYNRLLAVFPSGETLTYDKRHRFTMGGENKHFVAGQQQLVFDYKGARFAPFICYDLRFPVWSRNVNNEYDLIIYVACWPEARRQVWDVLLQARALENQCYVCGVNRTGTDGNGFAHNGGSIVYSPKGERLASIPDGHEGMATVNIDLESLRHFRQKFPVLDDADTFSIQR